MMKHILCYLKGIYDHGLYLSKSSALYLQEFADVDWVSGPDDRKSTSAYCILLGGNPIS